MVETSRLESGHTRKGIGGSNPSLSAIPISSLIPYLVLAAFALLHFYLLRLAFYWDEAGYYIPAARDLFLTGDLIPLSTLNTAHTPLLSLYLAVVWKIFGYGILSTRIAMLAVACFGLWQVYRLSENISNRRIAIVTLMLTASFPIVFAQSTIAHSDLMATALTWWGLREYFASTPRAWRFALAFTLAVLAKEIVLIVPLALAAYALLREQRLGIQKAVALCALPILALIGWFLFQRAATGHFFGDPDYYKYNVSGTMTPLRVLLAFAQRIWQTLGHMNMWFATLAMAAAMLLPPKSGRDRIAIPTQLALGAVILAMLIFHSLFGGALLTRYLLPIYPLIIVICVSTWWRRVPQWEWLAACTGILFAVFCVIDPPYRFAPEDNLAYARFIRLHETAARQIEQRFPQKTVLTAWPATDELTRPELGYVQKPLRIAEIHDFTAAEIANAPQRDFDVVLAFSTKQEPARPLLTSAWWTRMSTRYFGYHRDLRPEQIANAISGRVLWQQHSGGLWAAVIVRELPQDARACAPLTFDPADSRMR